jgi:hypothetical protein
VAKRIVNDKTQYVNAIGYGTKLVQRKTQLQVREKKREKMAHEPSHVIATTKEDWQAEVLEERRAHKKRKMHPGLYPGARIEVYWGEEVAGPGFAGFFSGEVVGLAEEEKDIAVGDYLIIYDDEVEKGNSEPIVECLFEGSPVEPEVWRFENQ